MKTELGNIDISGAGYKVANTDITRLGIAPLMLSDYVSILENINEKSNKEFAKKLNRERMIKQVSAIDASGTKHALAAADVMRLPVKSVNDILVRLDIVGSLERGQVLTAADGIDSPVLFKLGQSIDFTSKSGKTKIEELEIQARTYGDLESVYAVRTPIAQALELIRNCAKPVLVDGGLMRLTDAMINQVSVIDGLVVAEDVLPFFLN